MTPSSDQKTKSLPLDEIYGDTQRITTIFYWFITLILIGLSAGIFIVLSTNNTFAATVISVSMLPVLASLYLIRRQQFELSAAFLALVLITAITVTATNGLGIHHISVLGYPAILIVASLVIRKRVMVILTAYNILCAAWLVFGELSGAYTPTVLVRSVTGDFFSASIILILTAVMVRLISETLFQSSLNLQKELRERKLAEQKYRDLFDNAIDGIFQSTTNGRFVSVNPAMARMYGYDSPEDMINTVRDIADQLYVDPELRAAVRQRLTAGEQIKYFESLEYRKDGSTFWTSTNIQAIHDEAGDLLFYEGTVEDITRRKVSDEALRESEERYRTLFNGILDGVYRSTPAGKFLDVNSAMLKMFGYESRAEMLAVDIIKDMYFTSEDRHSLLLEPGQEKIEEFRMRRKDGSEIWVEDHGRYVQDEDGQLIFHEGILRDITPRRIAELERQQAQTALLASEQKYRLLFENMTSAFAVHKMIYDELGKPIDYHYLEINPAFEKLTGVPVNVLLGKTLKEVMPNTEEYWIETFGKVAVTGEPIAYTNFSRELGKHYDTYVFSPEKNIFAVVFNDVTEKVKAQEQVQKLNDELQERVRELEAKNTELEQFTYTVSHDLKAPIITIKGFLGFLEKDVAEGKQEHVHKDAARINEAVDKMHRLLNELLELSRIGRMMNAPETIPFNGLVQDALDVVHGRLAPRGITVLTQPDLPAVHGDRQRLTEVLQNLLDNAAKYMGGQSDPRIEIGQQGEENGKPIFFVKDNGIGIAPEYHERIFGLFNQLDPKAEGTGIGLALVKRIIEVHGGRIWVESAEGQGAAFYFTLARG